MIQEILRKYLKNMTRDFAEKASAVFYVFAGKLFRANCLFQKFRFPLNT